MYKRNRPTILATLIGAGALALTSGSVIAGNCNWSKYKNTVKYKHGADYHHAMYYGSKNFHDIHGFMKVAHHGAKMKDIVDTAASAGSFNTLVAAIKAAGLVETLKGDGPFTVFAPTDEAFAKIPKEDLSALLKDKEALTQVLTYHVVPGKVMAADVVELDTAKTVEGQPITIDSSSGVKINNANVIKTDISTSNGVIHVIDTVLIPKS